MSGFFKDKYTYTHVLTALICLTFYCIHVLQSDRVQLCNFLHVQVVLLDYKVLFVSDRFTRPLFNRKITHHFEFVLIQRCHGFVKMRVQAIVLLASGVSVSDVARQFHCRRNTINIPFLNQNPGTLMHDNARLHRLD